LGSQETWQEVCLIIERDADTFKTTTLVLNRPLAFSLQSPYANNLAHLLLQGSTSNDSTPTERNLMMKFMLAFEKECAIYVGGPDKMDEPAIILHGIATLEGATEISPGTGIFKGGLHAAIEGILKGSYKPLDFRFFVGRHEYKDGQLDLSVILGQYQPIACARSLVLKQCIQLPKPLWHEVMELCGGELKEISKLESMKRDDIQMEEMDEY